MSKDNIRKKNNKRKYKDDSKYNAENEIIIGVTTKQKEKARVDNQTSRASKRSNQKVQKNRNKTNRSNMENNKRGQAINKPRKTIVDTTKEKEIKKINRKKVILSIVVLLVISAAGGIYFLTTPMFNVSSIQIYGNNKNSADTYINLSEISLNETNIFAFTKKKIEKKLKENSYVEKVELKRIFPNKLEIYITERNIEYQAKYLDSYIYIDQQGNILEVNEEKQEVPVIEGLVSVQEDMQQSMRLKNEDLLKLDTILKIVNYLKYNNISENELTMINTQDTTNYILEFEKDDKIVYIGDSSSITEKMTAVVKILEAEKGKKGKIYANEDALKRNRIYFREEK